MSRSAIGLSVAVWCAGAAIGLAQQPGSAVQLPTWSSISAGTTVSVPDRGSVFLGGVKRAADGRGEFRSPLLPLRPFKNVGIGSERSVSNMHVSAYIHDFEAMDEFLLSQPTAFSQSLRRSPLPGARWTSAMAAGARNADGGPAWNSARAAGFVGAAEERHRRIQQESLRSEEAAEFFAQGQQAEAAGKLGVARIYYQMAARRATGQLQEQVADRLRAVQGGPSQAQIAQTPP